MTASEQNSVLLAWLDGHKGLLFKIVRAYAVTAMDMDDLFQEIVIQVWHSIPSFRQRSAISTWIYRIAINTALKWKARGRPLTEPISLVLEEHVAPVDERLSWLYSAIQQLDVIDRSITLLLLDGFSYKEIAAIMGLTESNVGVKINRIKKRLIEQSKKITHYGI